MSTGKKSVRKKGPLLIATTLAAITLVYTYLQPILAWERSPLLAFERKLLDLKFQWRGRINVDPKVVIAAGDEDTIKAFGRWGTWDRENYSHIIENLVKAGISVVSFDMVFADPPGIDHTHVAALKQLFDIEDLDEKVRVIEESFKAATDGDDKLVATYDEHGSLVVQGAVINTEPEDGKPRTASSYDKELEQLDAFIYREYGFGLKVKELDEASQQKGAEATIAQLDVHPGGKVSDLSALVEVKGELILPQPEFLDVAGNLGFFSAYVDPDGVLRRLPLMYRIGDTMLPALSVSTAALYFGGNPFVLADPFYKEGLAEIGFPRDDGSIVRVPVDLNGRLLINYYGPAGPNDPALADDVRGAFPRVSLADIYCADLPKTMSLDEQAQNSEQGERFRRCCFANDGCTERKLTKTIDDLKPIFDKRIALIAVTAIGTFDQRVTPFSPNVPGTEVHAAAIQNMIDGKALRRPALHVQVEMLLCVVIALLFGLVLPRLPVAGTMVFLVASFALLWFIDWNIMFKANRWFFDVPISLQMSLTWAGITVWGYLSEGREKARLKAEFSTVLAPNVVDQLLTNPDLAGLGGAERELTVMFSDIRGFTTMSEKLTPEGLTQFLNEYLTPMTELLIAHEGTLDKYMGDAIMAFWGAPIEQSDHAKRACITAVEMLEKLDELKKKWRAEGKPEIDIGIGLNSGLMRVGFMGSERMRNYTLLGDNVNLGSRLEGTNKNYGTHIIVSETTFAQASDVIHGRLLDAVRVKGKKEPVRIFEVIGKGPMPDSSKAFVEPFEKGFAAYQAQQWDVAEELFTQAQQARPGGDPASQLYLERVESFREAAPPTDWDGVYEFKTK